MSAKVKRVKRPAASETDERGVNRWLVLAGIIGLLFLGWLLYRAVQDPEVIFIPDYCRDNPDRCIAVGPADADVTFIEVAHYACRTCIQFYVETATFIQQAYLDEGYLRWLFVPYSNSAFPETAAAAEAAFCAAEQGNFYAYHSKIFGLQQNPFGLTDIGFLDSARQVGMNTAALTSCLDSDKYVPLVEANSEAILKAQIDTTPTFFVNDFKIEGVQSFAIFQRRIDREID